MSWNCRRKLKKAGVQFKLSPPLGFPYFFFKLNQRNHRKIVICDGQIGYYGGYNIGDEYLGRDPKFGKWRDLHIRMEGEALKELQRSFLVPYLLNLSTPSYLLLDILASSDYTRYHLSAVVSLIASRAGPRYLRGSYRSGFSANTSRTALADEIWLSVFTLIFA